MIIWQGIVKVSLWTLSNLSALRTSLNADNTCVL